MTEKKLRKRGALDPDDRLLEWKQGRIQRWSVAGKVQPLPRAFSKVDVPGLRGLAICSYSSQRLFVCSTGPLALIVGLESVWHADSSEKVLRLVFSAPQLITVCWQSDEGENAAALAAFAERIKARRDCRLACLPLQALGRAAAELAELERSELLDAAVAELGTPAPATRQCSQYSPGEGPRTHVGRWLRASLLRQTELRDRLKSELNGGKTTGWSHDEPAVVEAACELVAARFFGRSYDAGDVTAAIAELREATGGDPQVDALRAEALILLALGEKDADVSGMTPEQKFLIRGMFLAYATARLLFRMAEVDQLITDAEKLAFDRGWNPPLAR